MLIVFNSAASGEVIMLEANGKELLRVLGKDQDEPKGIVTVEQLPDAIGRVRRAMDASKVRHGAAAASREESTPDDAVQLSQRALPLLELLERSLQKQVPVTWGV